jgi:hypothetical protein
MTTTEIITDFLNTYPGQWMDMDQLVRDTGLPRSEAVAAVREMAAAGKVRFNRNINPAPFKLI